MVYFISNQQYVKIGFSKNVESRMSSLQTASPTKLTLLFSIDGDTYTESKLHEYFKDFRMEGEWFDILSLNITEQYLYDNILDLVMKVEEDVVEEKTNLWKYKLTKEVETNYYIIDSEEYIVIDSKALQKVKAMLNKAELSKLLIMSDEVISRFNIIYDKKNDIFHILLKV